MLNKNMDYLENELSFSKSIKIAREYKIKHPEMDVISLGIGDVSKPIVKPVIEAMHKAVDDEANMNSFQGYGIYHGLESLRKIVCENEYKQYGFTFEEIFIGDGTKSDVGNILELFDKDITVLMCNPLYPIYRDSCLCLSKNITIKDVDENYKLAVPSEHYDVIMLCTPCNPIGNAYNKNDLTKWVEYANKNDSVLIIDSVYNAFIESSDIPRSIYEIEGSKNCAIELRSFSKTASFTGVRCSYLVLPKEFKSNLISKWKERCVNRFNGASYIAQKGAEAVYTKEAQDLIKKNIKEYKENGAYLRKELLALGFEVIGGVDSPYLWVNTIDNLDSFDCFELILNKLQTIVVPGDAFGDKGRKHFRLSSFASKDTCEEFIRRLKKYYEEKN